MAIHKFTRLIENDEVIPMFGDGSSERDYTYIDDIIDGVVKAIDTPFKYEIFNLGGHHTTSLRALIDLIALHTGKTPLIDRQSCQPGDVGITCADISKATRMLGYSPRFSIESGIANFVDWFRSSRNDQGLLELAGASEPRYS